MRVRIRRFGRLRSRGEPRDPQLVEVSVWQSDVDGDLGVGPPPFRVRGNLRRRTLGHSTGAKLAKNRGSSLPLFQLQAPQSVTDPLVEIIEDTRRLGLLEVFPPAHQIRL